MSDNEYVLRPVGWVESPLVDRHTAPKHTDEGAPEAWIVFDEAVGDGLRGLHVGTEVFVLTWLHLASRDQVLVHPRMDPTRPRTGVFSTRSPYRPNPIGLHRTEITAIDGLRVRVRNLEAIDGTPVVDLKPVLRPVAER